jgi:hypothetical protein
LRLSALRIRYEIAQLKSRYDNHKLLPENAKHLAELTEEAYYDWAGRFPKGRRDGNAIAFAGADEELGSVAPRRIITSRYRPCNS